MKKSRSDSKAFEMSSLTAPRRVPVPVLVRDGQRCPSPSSLYKHAPDYGSTIGHHPTAFTSTAAHNAVHNSLMNAAAVHAGYSTSQYPQYNQYAASVAQADSAAAVQAAVHDSYLSNTNLSSAMSSPTGTQGSMHTGGHMSGFPSYNPQLVQQNCRWPW